MRDFADVLANKIIESEVPRIDSIMSEVTKNIRDDFADVTYSLIDDYYFEYTPIRYIRLYGRKKATRNKSGKTSAKSKGGVSLHAAITRMDGDGPVIGVYEGSYYEGYSAGLSFDEDYFKDPNIRHIGRGIDEWNIVENFLFSDSDGRGNHPEIQRSPAANDILIDMLNTYKARFDYHYKNACKNNK
jgi:hypothetical protein